MPLKLDPPGILPAMFSAYRDEANGTRLRNNLAGGNEGGHAAIRAAQVARQGQQRVTTAGSGNSHAAGPNLEVHYTYSETNGYSGRAKKGHTHYLSVSRDTLIKDMLRTMVRKIQTHYWDTAQMDRPMGFINM